MTLPYDKFAAIVALPETAVGQVNDVGLQKWLQRGNLERDTRPRETLHSILAQLDSSAVPDGVAALRMWGQTGDRPTVWIAAADPVYLEPRLDHLCLHALQDDGLSAGELGALFDSLQQQLAGHERYGFARIGAHGYLRASKPMPTSELPPGAIDAELPNDYLPVDVSGSYHSLRGEVELALHDHEVNLRRQAQGQPPINSLWIWGGGFAPEQVTQPYPPLFANAPTLRGHWYSKTAMVADWPGSINACLDASVAGFVAQPAEGAAGWVDDCLRELRLALKNDRLSRVTLLFGNRLVLRLGRSPGWKFWRGQNSLFENLA